MRRDEPVLLARFIWSLVHGIAMLAIDGQLRGEDEQGEALNRYATERIRTADRRGLGAPRSFRSGLFSPLGRRGLAFRRPATGILHGPLQARPLMTDFGCFWRFVARPVGFEEERMVRRLLDSRCAVRAVGRDRLRTGGRRSGRPARLAQGDGRREPEDHRDRRRRLVVADRPAVLGGRQLAAVRGRQLHARHRLRRQVVARGLHAAAGQLSDVRQGADGRAAHHGDRQRVLRLGHARQHAGAAHASLSRRRALSTSCGSSSSRSRRTGSSRRRSPPPTPKRSSMQLIGASDFGLSQFGRTGDDRLVHLPRQVQDQRHTSTTGISSSSSARGSRIRSTATWTTRCATRSTRTSAA